jgi:hypothetical protein
MFRKINMVLVADMVAAWWLSAMEYQKLNQPCGPNLKQLLRMLSTLPLLACTHHRPLNLERNHMHVSSESWFFFTAEKTNELSVSSTKRTHVLRILENKFLTMALAARGKK